ncbi:Mu transposase C-terminal domain-containing protein [Methylotenera sp.]|uniref:Mu transposase C-terminal domain-containing protein n=1 Tax=Methylotenera sp. TaxID=2051956 RepID=UPI0027195471|nr:Mu transposase C-terminal domain-containing protein [Methylotenera sp.]MDO9204065.1 Mu transposase C-terminal domain-containing protein [Methylotenera sp.]
MSGFALRQGLEFAMDNRSYVLRNEFEDGWQIEDMQSHRINSIKSNKLLESYMVGNLKAKINYLSSNSINSEINEWDLLLDEVTKEEQDEIKLKRTFVLFYRKKFNGKRSLVWIKKGLELFWNTAEMGVMPSSSTAYQWIKRFSESNDNIKSLIHRNYRKGNRVDRIDPDVSDICDAAIKEYFLKTTRATIQGALSKMVTLIDKENQNRPKSLQLNYASYTYIRNKIETLDKYVVDKARYGKEYADIKYRTSIGSTPTDGPMTRGEIDQTPMDVEVVDDNGQVIGRPTLTTIIDVETRCVLGVHLSFETNSTARVAAALKHAIFPKLDLKTKYPSIENEWPCYGLMNMIACDRGKEFLGDGFELLCLALGIELKIMPARRGDKKGTIERVQKTLNELVTENLPGKTFSSTHVRGNGINTREKACIRMSTLKEIVFKTIVDIYHQKKHRSLSMSPAEKWRQSVVQSELYLPISSEFFDAHSGMVEERKLSHTGIQLNTLHYNSIELGELFKKIGAVDVRLRWNQEDLGYIYVMPKFGGYIKVPVIPKSQKRAMGVSKYQDKVANKFLEKNGIHASDSAIANSREGILELIEGDRKKSRQKTRVRAERFENNQLNEDANQPVKSSKPSTSQVAKVQFDYPMNDEIPKLERY